MNCPRCGGKTIKGGDYLIVCSNCTWTSHQPVELPKPRILAEAKDLREAVWIALGAASVCWEELILQDENGQPVRTLGGRFQEERANQIGEELIEMIEKFIKSEVQSNVLLPNRAARRRANRR